MPTKILHIQSRSGLKETADEIFRLASVTDYELRDSDNYPGGEYWLGMTDRFKAKIALQSDEGWEDFQNWLVLSTASTSSESLESITESIVVTLLQNGFGVGREVGHTDQAIERELYSLESDSRLRAVNEFRPIS